MRASPWLGVILCAAALLSAQANSKPATHPKKAAQKSAAVSADDVNSLRAALAAQQRQMEQQRQWTR